MKEIDKWRKQKFAVNLTSRAIFRIDEVEVIGGEVVVFGGPLSNSSKNLHTVEEAHYIEKTRKGINTKN